MAREQLINFLEATVVFLLLTNALSILAAAWAIWLAGRVDDRKLKRLFAAWSKGRDSSLSTALRARSS